MPSVKQTASARRSPWQSRTRPPRTRSSKQVPLSLQKALHVLPGLLELAGGDGAPDIGLRLLEVLTPVAGDGLQAAEGVDLRPRLRRGVELGQAPRQGAHHLGCDGVLLQQVAHHALFRQALHLDRVVHDRARRIDRHAALHVGDGHHVQVDAGAEAPVEPHLLLAEVASLLQGGEVQEAEVHGLLHLVDEIAGQEDVGDVGLDEVDPPHLVGVGLRREEGGYVGRKAGHRITSLVTQTDTEHLMNVLLPALSF